MRPTPHDGPEINPAAPKLHQGDASVLSKPAPAPMLPEGFRAKGNPVIPLRTGVAIERAEERIFTLPDAARLKALVLAMGMAAAASAAPAPDVTRIA